MMKKTIGTFCALAMMGLCWISVTANASDPADKQPQPPDMAALMAKAKVITQPGPHHQVLKRFLGKWNTEMRIFMGPTASPPEKGEATFSWLMEGRWLKSEASGAIMGNSVQSFTIFGYDNFKMSYVFSSVNTMDTALLTAEGDMDPSGKAILLYGTLDEYLTGEHDKMVKYVWRFEGDDKMIQEIHDLPIGEKNTKVIEMTYTRK